MISKLCSFAKVADNGFSLKCEEASLAPGLLSLLICYTSPVVVMLRTTLYMSDAVSLPATKKVDQLSVGRAKRGLDTAKVDHLLGKLKLLFTGTTSF